jgi:uncharacterized protein YecT (DUF1311 family)
VLAALLLALASGACDQGTTYDMRTCWAKRDDAASDKLHATNRKVDDALRASGSDPRPLAAAQRAWGAARDKTCAFEYEQYLPGTIAPQLGVECDYRMTLARTRRLATLLARLESGRSPPDERPASPRAVAQLGAVYREYAKRLTPTLRSALINAQRAWTTYVDRACAIERGACRSELANERMTELQASWIGEPFL